jgi:hypothetical protein
MFFHESLHAEHAKSQNTSLVQNYLRLRGEASKSAASCSRWPSPSSPSAKQQTLVRAILQSKQTKKQQSKTKSYPLGAIRIVLSPQ